ncbi:rRNA maturation endonuclease Nob1 [Paenibacillus qinlingensis]|uniref:rRNA maturation endonuclease Nob1 n=1 Tax=Paenibacillus qinlingensis TaxID=1837343 RepID=A0ABU1P8T7_9BACL|nr:rRNA maturation endonuclease Nob1 [Paenibacillus qinlingensis]
MKKVRMDVYECDNCKPLFCVELGEPFECCPYCGHESTTYLNTIEIDAKESQ